MTCSTFAPVIAIVRDTFVIHPGTIDQHLTGKSSGYSLVNYIDLFTSRLARTNLWKPLMNTVLLSVLACMISILFGGIFAYLVTRTDMRCKKYLSSIFIFPYIMPQWTLAVVWQHMFNSNKVTGTADGLIASLFHVAMPKWFCQGLFPSALVLGLHYAPFAYILIGGIFKNMDANLEEAATILDDSSGFRFGDGVLSGAALPEPDDAFDQIHLDELEVYGRSQHTRDHHDDFRRPDSGPQPDDTDEPQELYDRHREIGTAFQGTSWQSGKTYCFFTSIWPIVLFALETFLPNPGDYSFLYTGDFSNLTTKWWITHENITENGMYGQQGILYNPTIWHAFKGTLFLAVMCALIAGTIGTLIGYSVAKNRRSKWAGYVNNIAFLPYLMPSIAVGAAFFILFSNQHINLFNTYTLLIMDQTDDKNYHPDSEVVHHQRLHTSVYDLYPGTVFVFTAVHAGIHPVDDAGLL